VTVDEDLQPAARFFGASFHQDCLVDDPDWESVVQRFRQSASPGELGRTREALLLLIERRNDTELEAFLFGEAGSSYDPRTDGLSCRAWIEDIVHLLAGGSSRPSDRKGIATARKKALAIVREILSGQKDVLLGARELGSLRYDVGVPEDDPDFLCFLAIDSETDALPLGAVRSKWDPEALAEKDLEIDRARQWAREVGQAHLESVLRRFGGDG
jgi:hypothetical protein